MRKHKSPEFNWDEENGIATCHLYYKDKEFVGVAKCAPDDLDMKSEKTGQNIALSRAKIQYYIYLRDCELLPYLREAQHIYACINSSTHSNEFTYENKFLRKEVQRISFDLATVRSMLATERKNLKEEIEEKDKFYKKIRAMRTKGKN